MILSFRAEFSNKQLHQRPERKREKHETHISFTQVRDTSLKHSQNLHKTTSNNHKHKEGNKTFAYRWIIGVFCRLAHGDLPTFIDVAIEFLLSIANVSWCWLCSIRETFEKLFVLGSELEVRRGKEKLSEKYDKHEKNQKIPDGMDRG